LLTLDQKHRAALSVEFVEKIDDGINVLKRIVTIKVGISYMIQKQNVRVQLG
jgi:hypothetical protein